jgi:hypothetical protein
MTTHIINRCEWQKLDPDWLRKLESHEALILSPGAAVVLADAIELADSDAICLIESDSYPHDVDGLRWWDTSHAEPDAGLEQALRYIAARGRLIRHPEVPDLVRFKDADDPVDAATHIANGDSR